MIVNQFSKVTSEGVKIYVNFWKGINLQLDFKRMKMKLMKNKKNDSDLFLRKGTSTDFKLKVRVKRLHV